MALHWLQRHLLAYLALAYALGGQPVAGIDTVYIVGSVLGLVLVWTVVSRVYDGYQRATTSAAGKSA